MRELRPYTEDINLSDYDLNDLLPKIWRDGYQCRDKWLEIDFICFMSIEGARVAWLPFSFAVVGYLWKVL